MAEPSSSKNAVVKKEDWRTTVLRREVLRHARTLEKLALTLEDAEDYPTETASVFCKLIRLTAKLIADNLNTAPANKLPFIFVILKSIGEHIRFAERSRIEQTPWSMVQATEAFLKEHTPKACCFILRPQWSYNYSIRSAFVETLQNCFESLNEWMPVSGWEKAMGNLAHCRIYCISFPRVERMNVLMHVNWGHEVGHILASDWLEQKFDNLWNKVEPGIKERITQHWQKTHLSPEQELLKTVYLDKYVASSIKDTMDLMESGLKELISDFVGAHLIGPAALACVGEFSVRYKLDENPINCGRYPPWRMRLRQILKAVGDDINGASLFAGNDQFRIDIEPFVKFLDEVKMITSSSDDLIEIDADIRTREAYKVIEQQWPVIQKDVLSLLPQGSRSAYRLKNRLAVVHELVLRIKDGIPPNETGYWPDNTPATLPDIWNASWAYKCLRLSEDENWATPNNLEDLFRLTLKAIESSYVHLKYGKDLKRVAMNEHTK